MSDPILRHGDLNFWLHHWLDAGTLIDAGTLDAFLDLTDQVATDRFLPHYRSADAQEPKVGPHGVELAPGIAEALRDYADLGFFSAGFPEDLGGLGLPFLACSASFASFAAANIATSAFAMLTVANARLIATFGSPAQIDHFARPQIAGQWFGTMCLSEPQAGSSLADIRTRATPDGEDALGARYRLRGNKMWISGGEHDLGGNIVHLVLAKVPGPDGNLPEGTPGISLFIVPRILPDGAHNDIALAGLNHKMGYRGIPNCLLNFGERDGAVGWLVGQPGDGLRQMFMMMNEARINVGLGAAALGYRSYQLALAYARDRAQGRPAGQRGGAPVPIIRHADVRRMLLTQKSLAEGAVALCLYAARLVDQEASNPEARALLELLTPVAKTLASEAGLEVNDIAIQIHGGYGYTRDFDVEQLWRDNRLNPIHEGTTGIQAMDLLGRKILRDGSGLAVLDRRLAATLAAAGEDADLAALVAPLRAARAQIGAAIGVLGGAAAAMDNATPFLRAFGHMVLGWLWLDQAVTARRLLEAGIGEAETAAGKIAACRFFVVHELPRVTAWLAPVLAKDATAAGIDESLF